MAVTVTTTASAEKKTVEHIVQRLVSSKSPPGQGPNDKYPINTSILCKNISLQCYLVTAVIHVHLYTVRYVNTYIHTLRTIWRSWQ